jgi:chromosome segregation ATPase
MDITSIIQSLAALGSTLAAVLAWVAKLQWAKEFQEAKEAQISALKGQIDALQAAHEERLRAKDEQIQTLNDKLLSLQDMASEKTAAFFQFTKSQLESYNDALKLRVTELEESIRDKEKLMESIPTDQAQYRQKIEDLESQKHLVEEKLAQIEVEKKNLERTLKSETASIPEESSSDTSIVSTVLGASSSLGSALLARPEAAMLAFLTLRAVTNRDKE